VRRGSGRAMLAAAVLLASLAVGGGGPAAGPPSGWRLQLSLGPAWARATPGWAAETASAEEPSGAAGIVRARALSRLAAAAAAFPVYPRSRPAGSVRAAPLATPASPYGMELWRQWRAPAGMRSVQQWLEAAAERSGWTSAGAGDVGNVHTPLVVEQAEITFDRGAAGSAMEMVVTLTPAGGSAPLLAILEPPDRGPTLVRYDATAVWTPPRPRASLVPADVYRVELQVTRDRLAGAPPTVLPVAAPATVEELRAAVNALPVDTDGRMGCAEGGGAATLGFVRPRGAPILVTVDQACATAVVAGRYHLFDGRGTLWSAVLAAAGAGDAR
jgi:hypothetical protein